MIELRKKPELNIRYCSIEECAEVLFYVKRFIKTHKQDPSVVDGLFGNQFYIKITKSGNISVRKI